MRKINQKKPLAHFIAASLAVGAMTGFGAQAYAATSAGTLIKNLATVTYEDAGGNTYTAQSNEAVVTVAAVYSGTLENDNVLTAAPGQTVYFPHVLSNTGNIQDTYDITAVGATAGSVVTIYNDLNNNGQPDTGEPVLSSVTVAAGEQANIVVAMQIPTTAVANDEFDVKLNVASVATGAIVKDTGLNGDADADDTSATNDDKATVSTGPVLVLNKSSVHDAANNQVTYTLTVKNNGASAANNVQISDLLPLVDTNGDAANDTTDANNTLQQVSFISAISSGLLNAGDVPADEVSIDDDDNADEDNLTTDNLNVITATDVNLPPNTTISVTYTVSYAPGWAANADINNTFTATSDEITTSVSSNTTTDVIPQTYGVEATDNLLNNASPGVNDGGDDDASSNIELQVVDSAATGEEVLFTHTIENKGNGEDTFNLDVTNTDFPAGTVFSLWDATGTVQLTDSDNDGVPDTGILDASGTTVVMIKAKLPTGISGPGVYDAVLTATSSKKPSVSNDTNLQLLAITPPAIDLASGNPTSQFATSVAAGGFNDTAGVDAHKDGPVELADSVVGGSVVFPLELANESGSADSYVLSTANIPEGWDVVYKDLSGNVITTTTLLPGRDSTDLTKNVFKYEAHVTISSDPSQAKSDADQTGAVDGAVNDSGTATDGDADKDYFIDFIATSSLTTTLTDTVRNAVDVAPDREVAITPNGQNQIQPGGTVDYSHKLENNGNQPETVTLGAVDSKATDGWTTLIRVDTSGDGIPDTVLVAGTTTTVKGSRTDPTTGVVTYVDVPVTVSATGVPTFTIPAGVDIPFVTTVSAPSTAPLGTVNQTTLTASTSDTDLTDVVATDQTTVILGQVRLDKQAAIDADCNPLTAPTAFAANQTATVEPGQCVTWRLTATNEGNAPVLNVVLSDAAPEYTDLVTNALLYCKGNSCIVASVTDADDAADDASIDVSTGIVVFKTDKLEPSQTATGQFMVKVQ